MKQRRKVWYIKPICKEIERVLFIQTICLLFPDKELALGKVRKKSFQLHLNTILLINKDVTCIQSL